MQALEFVVVVIIVALLARGFKYLKAIPIKPQTAFIIAILVAGVGAYNWNWGGFKDVLAGVEIAPEEPAVTPGVTFEAEGSEDDSNLFYDQSTRVFTCSFVENVSADNVGASVTPYGTIDNVTFTITVFRTDLLALAENAVAKIEATVPTFYGKDENASTLYWPIDKDSATQKYEIAFTPVGGSARDGYNHFTVGSGGSKAITVVADTYHLGLAQLDNFQSKDVQISITGLAQSFTLRYTKTGEVT